MPNQKRVVIQAAVDTHSGLGQLFSEIFSGLMRRGIEVAVRPIQLEERFTRVPHIIQERFVMPAQPEEWELLIASLAADVHPTKGKKTIYFSMWETDAIGMQQLKVLSRAHAIIVPSEWNKRMFEKAGVLTPIYVVPLGINPEIFFYRDMDMSGPTTFITGGRQMNVSKERKGAGTILTAFKQAFGDREDVKLSIKTFPDDAFEPPPGGNIEIIKSVWSWDLILHWMMKGTAFVHASQEGWGLMQHQAMAVGRPLIGPIWGASADFVTPASSYPIKYRMVDAGWVYRNISGGQWPTMDVDDLAREMRRIHMDREEAKNKGELSSLIAAPLTWDNTVTKLLDIFDSLGVLS